MVEGGWSVEFHSCVDLYMMRGVVGCMHGGRGRWLSRLLQAVKGSVSSKGIVYKRNKETQQSIQFIVRINTM